MKNISLEELPLTQIERLEFIEFCLDFYGRISRQELSLCLQLATASCTRDLALYRQLAPDNLEMRHQDKSYYRTDNFQRIFFHTPKKSLAHLTRYYPILSRNSRNNAINVDFNFDNSLRYPSVDVLAVVNRAIVSRHVLKTEYQSLRHGALKREIVPHALFNGYRGWYVRAYDLTMSQFLDYSLCNIQSVKLSTRETLETDFAEDTRWNSDVKVSLIPHPFVSNKRAVELMYKMTDGYLTFETNEVVAAHLLRRENVVIESGSSTETGRLLSLKSGITINLSLDEL